MNVKRVNGLTLASTLRVKVDDYCTSVVSAYYPKAEARNQHLLVEVVTYRMIRRSMTLPGMDNPLYDLHVLVSNGESTKVSFRVFSDGAAKDYINRMWDEGVVY